MNLCMKIAIFIRTANKNITLCSFFSFSNISFRLPHFHKFIALLEKSNSRCFRELYNLYFISIENYAFIQVNIF